jgi:hypothetical protein
MSTEYFGSIPIVYSGIGILFAATVVATMGHVTMKVHANKMHSLKTSSSWFERKKYIILSVAMYVIGGLVDLSVNRLVPFYIRACFAALDIPIYVILARVILHERLDRKQVMGVLISVIGCTGAVFLGAHTVANASHAHVLDNVFSYRVGMLIAITVPIFLGCTFIVRDTIKQQHGNLVAHENAHGRMFLLVCSVFASSYAATWASLLVRVVSELSNTSIFEVYTILMGMALILVSLGQLATMADMLSLFKSVVSMPFYLICNSAGIVILSGVVFNEIPSHPILFGLSMALGFVGIAFIVHKTPEEIEEDPDEHDDLVAPNSPSIKLRE